MKTQVGDLMTIDELSKLIGIQKSSIRQGAGGTRDLPYLKLGGRIRYRRKDVEVWLESNRHEPKENVRVWNRRRA